VPALTQVREDLAEVAVWSSGSMSGQITCSTARTAVA
jgi:hypothetical protein